MTVATPEASGTEVTPYDPSDDVGLEDIGIGDLVIPRLRIKHAEGLFEDSLSKATFTSLRVVLLGLVKQRIMWDDEVDDGDKPMCKSPDFEHGFPNVRDDVKADKRFPWERSNFDAASFPAQEGLNGLVTLPCQSCIFKEWNKSDWKTPPCSEQHTYPLLYSPDESGDNWVPAIFSVQKTGIKPSKTYISYFGSTKTPLFTVYTELSLTQASRGSVNYSVPNFKKLEATDRAFWGEYADQARGVRTFLRQAPRGQDEDDSFAAAPATVDSTAVAATPEPAAPPAPPVPAAPAPAAPAAPAPVAEAAPAAPVAAAAAPDDLPF